jgi:3-oxoacyl-[acyl-carrier protein] reductase
MKKYSEINIGDSAVLNHRITKADIDKFVDLTGDDNKLHVDEQFASNTSFKKPVAHGMLGASFISTIIGTKLPGDGALWFSQSLEFLLPVRIGDDLTVSAIVTKKVDKDQIIELNVEIKNQDRQTVTKGVSKVKLVDFVSQVEPVSDAPKMQQVALVIGGTGGIGKAVCKQLAADGFKVLIHYFSKKDSAEEIKKNIEKHGGQAYTLQADITNAGERKNISDFLKRYDLQVDVLINCSSMKIPKIAMAELSWNDFEEQINFHIRSTFEICKLFVTELAPNGKGKIINIGTLAADKPNTDWLHYITAKSALTGFTKALAFELGPKGVTVNMVSPGLTDTELTSNIPEKVKLITASQTPLRRLTTVEDVAGAVAFLASDKANFITGENIRVNGGQFSI